jgi:lipopolysaccharide transport system ATP-binding protein
LKTGYPAQFAFYVNATIPGISCNFLIYDSIGQPLTSFQSRVRGPQDSHDHENDRRFVCELDELLLLPGRYRVDVAIVGDSKLQDFIEAAAVFEVGEGHIGGRPAQPDEKFRVSMPHRWTIPAKS